jgi:hypothetical protein
MLIYKRFNEKGCKTKTFCYIQEEKAGPKSQLKTFLKRNFLLPEAYTGGD